MNTTVLDSFEETLYDVINSRKEKLSAPRDVQIEAEETVCIESRTLFSRFVDVFMMGGVSPSEIASVRKALKDALDSIQVDEICKDAVTTRVKEFEQFLKRNRS